MIVGYQSPSDSQLLHREVDEPARGQHPRQNTARDRRDAGEVDGREESDPDEDRERVERDVALLVGEERTAEAGDEGADCEGQQLHAHDVDAGPGSRALVRAYRQHLGTESARA